MFESAQKGFFYLCFFFFLFLLFFFLDERVLRMNDATKAGFFGFAVEVSET